VTSKQSGELNISIRIFTKYFEHLTYVLNICDHVWENRDRGGKRHNV